MLNIILKYIMILGVCLFYLIPIHLQTYNVFTVEHV